jgi:DNA-binding transcriptional regulator YiaG
MKQEHHKNAVTNLHIRKQIKESSLKNIESAETFNTSVATISKWRNRVSIR